MRALTDGDLKNAYSSELGHIDDHEEWIQLECEDTKQFSHVVLYPAADGFPLDFTIEVWDGKKWVQRREMRWSSEPYNAMVVEMFEGGTGGTDWTTKFRIKATRLRRATGSPNFVLRFAEIELRN